jgi:TonB family protein
MKPARAVALSLLAGVLVSGSPLLAQEPPLVAGADGVPVPKKTKAVKPTYPPEALAQGLRGIVILDLLIDAQGKVASTSVVRSVPGLDEAAIAAARQWEYEPTKVDGKPVSVRLTVPITFTLALPALARDSGIPELRQGIAPGLPKDKSEAGSVVAEVTLEGDGRVGTARVVEGVEPWAGALLAALQTWRFSPPPEDASLSFRVEAQFAPARGTEPGRVALKATGLQRSDMLASSTPGPAAPATAAPAAATPAASTPAASTPAAAAPATTTAPATAPAAATPAAGAPAAARPAPGAPTPATPATGTPPAGAPAAPAAPPPGEAPAAPASSALPRTAVAQSAPPAAPPPGAPAAPGSGPDMPSPRTPPPAPGAPGGVTPGATPHAGGPPPAATPPVTVPPAATTPGGQATPAAPADRSAAPTVEVITAPAPTLPPENGVSAVRDVTLEPGVPDLTRGRRPVAPPLARMSGATGTVEVAFSVSAAGTTQVQSVSGPDLLKKAAEQAVASWVFRRTRADRAYLAATFSFAADKTAAVVRPQAPAAAGTAPAALASPAGQSPAVPAPAVPPSAGAIAAPQPAGAAQPAAPQQAAPQPSAPRPPQPPPARRP